MIVGLILAVAGGTIIGKAHLEDQVASFVYGTRNGDVSEAELTRKDRISFSVEQVKDVVKKVWPYILIGVGIGAAIHNWIPESIITAILGQDK